YSWIRRIAAICCRVKCTHSFVSGWRRRLWRTQPCAPSVTRSRGITPPVGHQTHFLRDTDRLARQLRHSLRGLDMPPLVVAAGAVRAADRVPTSVAPLVGDLWALSQIFIGGDLWYGLSR